MGKICWINGQPYSVGLPTGGKDKIYPNNQWSEMINFLGEDCDDLFHWKNVFSWCQEKVNASYRVVRGCNSARYWGWSSAPCRSPSLGFRPVLMPLNTDTLKPDLPLLTDIPDGQKIALTSLYMGGKPVNLSKRKVPNYNNGEEVILGNRIRNKNYWLYVIKHGNLLWADRNILVDISWDELQKQGYVD